MEIDQVPELDLHPVPEDDDLNATVIEVMTDVEVLHDGSSVIDVFAVSSARRNVSKSVRAICDWSEAFQKGEGVVASILA